VCGRKIDVDFFARFEYAYNIGDTRIRGVVALGVMFGAVYRVEG